MKKGLLLIAMLLTPLAANASRQVGETRGVPASSDIPEIFSMPKQNKTYEWACPISFELVKAPNKRAAMNRLIKECSEQIRKAAEEKPGVVAVLETALIAPNVTMSEESDGFIVNGTFFFRTSVATKE